jgi:hypothetical protein
MDSHMMCEVCGDVKHSGNNCPKTREEASYINNGFRLGYNTGETTKTARKEVIISILTLIRINLP